MKAAVLREVGNPLVLDDREVPLPGAGDVLVKIEAAEVSRSIVERVKGTTYMSVRTPIVLGTGGAGTVHQVGGEVKAAKVGDRVAIDALTSCGRCYNCSSGRDDLCEEGGLAGYQADGTFAEFVVVPEERLVRIPSSMAWEEAAIMPSSLGAPFSALRKAGVGYEHVLAVFGLGALGFTAVQLGKLRGARVIGVDAAVEKLDAARGVGADATVLVTEDVPRRIQEFSGAKRGADFALVTVGNAGAMEEAARSVRKGGTVIVLGDSQDFIRVKPMQLIGGLTVTGSMYFRQVDIPELERTLERNQVELACLVDAVYPLEEVNDAVNRLHEAGSTLNRLIVKPGLRPRPTAD